MSGLNGSAKYLRNSRIVALTFAIGIIVGIAVTVSVGAFGMPTCDEDSDPAVRSPDGKWAATSASESCPTGPLSVTQYGVYVTLAANPAPSPAAGLMRIFEAQSMAEQPHVVWASTNELRIELREEGTVRTSKHEVAGIRITYIVPKWIWDRLGAIESDRLRDDKQSEELFTAGKMNRNDLRTSLQISEDVAKERAAFRQWVLDNAVVAGDANASSQAPKR